MIDRAARTAVRAAVEDFLFDRIKSFEFDDRLRAITTEDSTVRIAKLDLWGYYDDIKDHVVVADKATWDYIQRWLLILDSDAEVIETSHRRWHTSQLIAIVTLVCLWFAYRAHPEIWLPPVMFGGVVSILLGLWRRQNALATLAPDPWRCRPFPSLKSLRCVLERTSSFHKVRFRGELNERVLRSPSESRFAWLRFGFGWLMWSPIPLLFQTLPVRWRTISVAEGGASDAS
jgi:hypothetical protein